MAALRRWVRTWLPDSLRLRVARARRWMRDRMTGTSGRIARNRIAGDDPPYRVVEIAQPIRDTGLAGKIANIRLGAQRLDGVTIAPGEIFSFWALVGEPSERAGFELGRSIRNGVVGGEPGGGLCQVSGIAYELLLRAGLDVIERHAHSRDLYDEAERFTPLGLDATVVWPYRDLRAANRLGVPVTARFAVEGMTLRATLCAPSTLASMDLRIERSDHPDHRDVVVTRAGVTVTRDRYSVAPNSPNASGSNAVRNSA